MILSLHPLRRKLMLSVWFQNPPFGWCFAESVPTHWWRRGEASEGEILSLGLCSCQYFVIFDSLLYVIWITQISFVQRKLQHISVLKNILECSIRLVLLHGAWFMEDDIPFLPGLPFARRNHTTFFVRTETSGKWKTCDLCGSCATKCARA